MARYVYSYDLLDVALIHRAFLEAIRLANQAGRPNSAAALTRAYRRYQADLGLAALKGAQSAERLMKERFEATRRRSDTGQKPHLKDLLTARPFAPVAGLQMGSVGIGDLDKLERARGDDGFAYWEVQELGSTANVNRKILGFFYDKGLTGATRPAPGYTGTKSAQPLFVPGSVLSGPRGGSGGKGVIKNPIPERHFVRDGMRAGSTTWLADMQRIEGRALAEVVALSAAPRRRVRSSPRGRRLR